MKIIALKSDLALSILHFIAKTDSGYGQAPALNFTQ
jgi:hypothetical protein